nr:MAG TPA: hypothetical protein [Caudoviricetes sp.]
MGKLFQIYKFKKINYRFSKSKSIFINKDTLFILILPEHNFIIYINVNNF